MRELGYIGQEWTHMAIKDENSFLIGTVNSGLKLIDEGEEIFKGSIPLEQQRGFLAMLFSSDLPPMDMIYIQPLYCYFFQHKMKLYRKDITNKPPYLYMDVLCGVRNGACFRYSNLHEKLIINKDAQNISVVDLQRKKVEIEVKKRVGMGIMDFRLFGSKEDQVVSVTNDGFVLLYKLDYGQKRGSVIDHSEIKLFRDRAEMPVSVAVCGKGEYVFVEIGQGQIPWVSCRIVVLQIRGKSLTQKHTFELAKTGVNEKFAFEFFRYVGRHILLVGLSRKCGSALVYDFDTRTGELRGLGGNKVSHEEKDPAKLHRLGDKFYYTGDLGNLMSLSITFN